MSLKGKLEIVAKTDVGQIRDHNEDYINASDVMGYALLADGMGGLNAGEVASSMSVHLLMDEMIAYRQDPALKEAELMDDESDLSPPAKFVKAAINQANSAVFHVSQTQPQCRGMGTTILASLFYDNKVAIGHIGDSRVYRFRDEKLAPITKDHSFVQELIDKGLYTEEEARLSNRKNVVTRALGVGPDVDVEVHEHECEVGDIYLLCSDGITDLIEDADIEVTISQMNKKLDACAQYLVTLANASGGKDNISVILVRVVKPFPAEGGLVDKIVNWFE